MGISGLLPFLEKASRKTHVSEFKGATVAVDAYCWLHKGAFGCAEKLARGEDTNGYVLYCMKYIKLLQLYKIRPIMVFDGQHLPAKKITEDKRREQRRMSKQRAAEMLRLGNLAEARKYITQSVDISHQMALALIKECRAQGIDCIVAPYEADAQLAYLNLTSLADFVISEDSDLLLFGCKKILFKMDVHGHGTLVEAEKINDCMKLRHDKFTFNKFRYMCILSGCDYLENLPGVGLKKALKFISVTENPSIYNVLPKLPTYLKLNNVTVTDEYKKNFMIADATFQHQLVFDPVKRRLLPLNPLTSETKVEHCINAGDMADDRVAFQLALGNIDPFTHKKMDDWNPDANSMSTFSIWARNVCKPKDSKKISSKSFSDSPKTTSIIIKSTQEEESSKDPEIENIIDMYRKLGSPKKTENSITQDLCTLIHGKEATRSKRCTSAFLKFGSTVVDYENGLRSRFFKPKIQEPQDDSKGGSMVSLLSAIDNLEKKRKTVENDSNDLEKSPEIIKRRRKSDLENKHDMKMSISSLEHFRYKKSEMILSSANLVHNITNCENKHDNSRNLTLIKSQIDENAEGILEKQKDDLEKHEIMETSTAASHDKKSHLFIATSISKKQTTLLNFFSKH